MAEWTKMPLGMEVGLGQATLCSMGTLHTAPHPMHGTAPQIRSTILALYKLVCMYVCLLWPNGWMDQDATW